MKRLAVLLSVLLLTTLSVAAQAGRRPFTVDDLLVVRRVSDPQLSPDGKWVAYNVADTDRAANKRLTQIYLVSANGGEPRQLTNGKQSATAPRWSPDGSRLAFITASDGTPQIWTIEISSGKLQKISNISTGADNPVWSPDGKWLAFASDIYPECATDECNAQREQQAAESKVKARVIDRLLFRHWSTWKEGKRSHVFVVSSAGGAARDLTPGDFDAPPFSLGGPAAYAFSPDSTELAFERNTDKVEATSTNGDIFTVPVNGGEARRITASNLANDQSPVYSPDGRFIAYRAQVRPGFESDRWRLMLYDRKSGQARPLTDKFDSSGEGFTFAPDSRTIYFVAAERGRHNIYSLKTDGGEIRKVISGSFDDDLQISRDGKTLIFTRQSMTRPVEIFRAGADGRGVIQLTHTNDVMFANLSLPMPEDVEWTGAAGTRIHGFLAKPHNFDASKKYPMIVLIHGGPQGAWNNNWSYRWNPQIFASAGYVVFMPNPRGSTGYGQQFVDEISGDWGGKVVTDIMNGVKQVAAAPYVDRARVGAAGGSYGGYMVNWIEGHNDDSALQFKALVSHAGVFNLTSMAGVTEELWFTNAEFGGTPWTNPQMYERWSPHMFVKNFKTPLLVIHGELDFRVPIGEGLQLFTALQMQGVESKLLYFPDEGHWILKPQNSELWYRTVLGWFDKHLKTNS